MQFKLSFSKDRSKKENLKKVKAKKEIKIAVKRNKKGKTH